jgi:energy-coupling factor transport system permease protein
VSVGYLRGNGPLHKSHPFTPLVLAATLAILAFTLPVPWGPLVLCAVALTLAVVEGATQVLKPALITALPFWVFLFLIHTVAGGSAATALAIASRITTIVLMFLTVVASVEPARLVDAALDRGLPFSVAYLFAATLQAVPRLRRRAGEILDAQRCRGLPVSGSLWRRARAVVPLTLPLILGALAEVDERTLALESRGAAQVIRRTSLHPPTDTRAQRVFRWSAIAIAIGAVVVRLFA